MLQPNGKIKYRRVQRGRMKGKALRGNKITNGSYGLVATEPAWITSNQIEAARIAMTRFIKRGGKVWIYTGQVLQVSNNERRERPARRRPRKDNREGGAK